MCTSYPYPPSLHNNRAGMNRHAESSHLVYKLYSGGDDDPWRQRSRKEFELFKGRRMNDMEKGVAKSVNLDAFQ